MSAGWAARQLNWGTGLRSKRDLAVRSKTVLLEAAAAPSPPKKAGWTGELPALLISFLLSQCGRWPMNAWDLTSKRGNALHLFTTATIEHGGLDIQECPTMINIAFLGYHGALVCPVSETFLFQKCDIMRLCVLSLFGVLFLSSSSTPTLRAGALNSDEVRPPWQPGGREWGGLGPSTRSFLVSRSSGGKC